MMQAVRIHSAEDPRFGELVRIYTEALPASERKSVDALRQMIARPEYFFLAAVDADALVGFAITIAFVESDAALLEYMAVDAARRSEGLGEALFRATAAWPELSSRFLLSEVESETADGAGPDAELRARRKGFYRRLGAKEIEGLTYIMPPVSSAQPPAMHMLVLRGGFPTIAKARVRAWLEACYGQVYGVPQSDPRIEEMLSGLPETIRLV
jgi:GNAT superfamily N-acetyltransferase